MQQFSGIEAYNSFLSLQNKDIYTSFFSQLKTNLRCSSKEYKKLQETSGLAIHFIRKVPNVPGWRLNGLDHIDHTQFPKPGEEQAGMLCLHAVERKYRVLLLCITSENQDQELGI